AATSAAPIRSVVSLGIGADPRRQTRQYSTPSAPPAVATATTVIVSVPRCQRSADRRLDRRLTRARLKRPLQLLEHAHDAQPALRARARRLAVADPVDEVAALDPERLFVRHARGPYVPRPRDVFAVRRD